jgi:hypothetical protein
MKEGISCLVMITYPLNSNVCFAIAFECVLLGLVGYLIRPLPCCLLPVPPGVLTLLPDAPAATLLVPLLLKGDVDRDRDDPYADDDEGGKGEED